VCPKREVKRFADLSSNEISDLWVTAKEVGIRLEQYHKASSLTFAIQDGPQAGQTVPHVHIHVIPRKKGDFEKNDEIYDAVCGIFLNRPPFIQYLNPIFTTKFLLSCFLID
jgi:bis(5'-adenosyl)-triphosphatase